LRRIPCLVLACFLTIAPDSLCSCFNASIWKNISSRYQVFLIFDPNNLDHRIVMRYASCLFHLLKDMSVDFIGISTGNFDVTMEAKRICSISFPIILEKDVDFMKKNNLITCCGATILVDPENTVIFRDDQLLPPALLSQLLERQLNMEKRIFDQAIWIPPFLRGDILNNFPITKVKNEENSHLTLSMKNINIITFFSSFSLCPECRHIKRLETIRKISEEDYSDMLYIGICFLEPFTIRDIRKILNNLPFEVPFESFTTQNFMPCENILIIDDRLKCDPWTIITDNQGRVIWSEETGRTEKDLLIEINQVIKQFYGY